MLRIIRHLWRTSRSLTLAIAAMWLIGGAGTFYGLSLESTGFWGSHPFATNIYSALVGAMFGIPVAVLLIQQFSSLSARAIANAQVESGVHESARRLEARANDLVHGGGKRPSQLTMASGVFATGESPGAEPNQIAYQTALYQNGLLAISETATQLRARIAQVESADLPADLLSKLDEYIKRFDECAIECLSMASSVKDRDSLVAWHKAETRLLTASNALAYVAHAALTNNTQILKRIEPWPVDDE